MGKMGTKPWCRRMKRVEENDTTSSKRQCHCKTQEKVGEEEEEARLEWKLVELDILKGMNDELLCEVLIRLPSKCACRYKAVCKRWSGLISSSYFITQSINCHPKQNSFTLVLQYNISQIVRIDKVRGGSGLFKDDCFPVQFLSTHPLLSSSHKNQYFKFNVDGSLKRNYILASCDDLLLCTDCNEFYVINLLTGQWIVLPRPDENLYPVSTSYISGIVGHTDGEGCYRFKVIIIPTTYRYKLTIRVFCSELGHWTRLVVDWYSLDYRFRINNFAFSPRIVTHNGRLHWVHQDSLVSLDVFNGDPLMRLSHSINLPCDAGYRGPAMFGVCQGHFRVSVVSFHDVTTNRRILVVWELDQDYQQKGVWKLAHRVELWNTPARRYLHFKLLTFHPYDTDLIFVNVRRHIILFNMKTGTFERYCRLHQEHWNDNCWRLRSFQLLLHPRFPTMLPSTPPPSDVTAEAPLALPPPHTQ